MTTVEELHGVFQFNDDLFDDNQPTERILTVDKEYNPREIFPGWFETGTQSIPSASEAKNLSTLSNSILNLRTPSPSRSALTCPWIASKVFHDSWIVRDCSRNRHPLLFLRLSRPHEALPSPASHGCRGTQPLIVPQSHVYFECALYSECVTECREYLKLRPGLCHINETGGMSHKLEIYRRRRVESLLDFVKQLSKHTLFQVRLSKKPDLGTHFKLKNNKSRPNLIQC